MGPEKGKCLPKITGPSTRLIAGHFTHAKSCFTGPSGSGTRISPGYKMRKVAQRRWNWSTLPQLSKGRGSLALECALSGEGLLRGHRASVEEQVTDFNFFLPPFQLSSTALPSAVGSELHPILLLTPQPGGFSCCLVTAHGPCFHPTPSSFLSHGPS